MLSDQVGEYLETFWQDKLSQEVVVQRTGPWGPPQGPWPGRIFTAHFTNDKRTILGQRRLC